MMTPSYQQKIWIPYLVATVGTILSFLLWYVFWQDLHTYQAWFALLLGILWILTLSFALRMVQIAKECTQAANTMHEDLKKEIGERIYAEETKQKLEVALLQGQKLQAIGTLAGGIAHDFNNILYAIIGYIELARGEVPKDSLTYKNLGKVLEGTHRGQELISRILAFSRRQHHQLETLDLKSTIEAALGLLRPTIPASVSIEFEAMEDNAEILGNQTQIHQVLVNIINNAVDAMDGEGVLTIKLSHVPMSHPFLKQFPGISAQNYCKLEISDTGHGMDQHTMERIFEPFFTTKEVGKGTGLGLSIVHSIIKEHRGEITVSSQLGHGTTLMILLPEQLSK